MVKNPLEQNVKSMLLTVSCMIIITFIFGFLAYGSLSLLESGTNDTEENEFNIYLENITSNTSVFYQNVTVVDKEHRERSLMGDVYNVVYETETGDIQKDNNITLYYSVEEGHSYNVSGKYAIRRIVEEI